MNLILPGGVCVSHRISIGDKMNRYKAIKQLCIPKQFSKNKLTYIDVIV